MKRTDSLPLSRKLILAATAVSILTVFLLIVCMGGAVLLGGRSKEKSPFAPDYVYNELIVDAYCDLPDPVLTLNAKDYPENLFSVGYEHSVTVADKPVTVGMVLTFHDGTTRVENITLIPGGEAVE